MLLMLMILMILVESRAFQSLPVLLFSYYYLGYVIPKLHVLIFVPKLFTTLRGALIRSGFF